MQETCSIQMMKMEEDTDDKYSTDRSAISPSNTVLWFEFLVDPSLLLPHLGKQKPDPTPTELITKLLTVYMDSSSRLEFSFRGFALKILALKIAAYLQWDLKVFQCKLPLTIQIKLLEDLMFIATAGIQTRMGGEKLIVDIENAPNEVLFAAVLWHRWIISGLVFRGLQNKGLRPQPMQMPAMLDNGLNAQFPDDFSRNLESILPDSITFLQDVLASKRIPNIPTFETFVALTDESKEIKQNWSVVIPISEEEFYSQIHYDLATFYFYKLQWKLSKEHFLRCSEMYEKISDKEVSYFGKSNLPDLKGYLLANGECFNGHKASLLYKFYASIRNGFTGTVSIIQQDNMERSLPFIHRQIMEVETFGTISSEKYYVAKDILMQFSISNIIRNVVDDVTLCPMKLINSLHNTGPKSINLLISMIASMADTFSETDQKRVRNFFISCAPNISNLGTKLKNQLPKSNSLFTSDELVQLDVLSKTKMLTLPHFQDDLSNPKNPFRDCHNLTFEQKLLQHKLINCYEFAALYALVVEWNKKTQKKPLWRINPKWQLPIPLQSVVMSIEDHMLQNIAFLILAKGRELMLAKDYENSLRMYSQVDTEYIRNSTNPAIAKLWKLVSWELLLVKVIKYTEKWSNQYLTPEEKTELISKCKECLSTQQTDYTANVIPRTELIEHLSLFLLNVGEWEFIMSLEKRWNYFELTTAVAYACQDLIKGAKKLNKDVWELILPVFGPSPNVQQKRGSASSSLLHRDSPTAKTKLNILSFMSSLRNEHALGVMIALLARLYNILKDESSLELIVDHISLWPAVISNANSYNHKSVSEMLWQTLEIALHYYPNNVSWLKLKGDINFCNEYPETALKCYLKSLIVATDYFTQPIAKPLIDDHTIKRMIKCCVEVHCYTQAVVLCQFLDQIDYATAFQCLGETKPGNCHDAMDAYYSCIWDTTILEYLINLHHKRGEEHRKREAIKIIGQLELNSNNSDEIKKEASDIRKRKFMRALAKQYVIKYPI